MVSRVLIAVLMLVGPMPFRVCTCGAAPAACAEPHFPAPAPVEFGCSCGHHHEASDAGDAGGRVGNEPVAATGHTHPPQHHPGCPTTQVRPGHDATPPAEVHSGTADSAPGTVV